MARLIVVDGPGIGDEFELAAAGGRASFVAGRDASAEVRLQDTAASRRHFRVELAGEGWRVVDLGSRNQTLLNGAAVREAALRHGDLIRAGDTELRFEDPGAPVRPSGARSTILREFPAVLRRDSLVERLETLERAVRDERSLELAEGMRRILEIYAETPPAASPQELFEKVLARVVPLVRADYGAAILEEDGNWVVRAACGAETNALRPDPGEIRASTAVIEKVAGEGKAILAKDAAADERFRGRESIVRGEIASVIAAPIAAGGRTAGVLYADRRGRKEPFGEADLELLALAALPAGALLERAALEEALRLENRNLYRSLGGARRIVGTSPAILKVLEFIRRAAPTGMTVLIQGETGTGKELVASAIHYSSPRRGRPFVALNCAALPENLVESELFGHERGAFTGAVTKKKGRFELAEGGTIFLDEISELSLACQAKILRLIEEKTFERVGGVEPLRADARIIAATNKDLLAEVNAGMFREDLYYRLNVLAVSIPPLRERREDIETLALHFLKECGGREKKLSKKALQRLLEYPWPGNVRQLRNVIESAYVLGEGPEIRPEDLALKEPGARFAASLAADSAKAAGAPPGEPWRPISLAELEKEHIRKVLAHTGGNKKRAAEILGIERCTLYAKIRQHEL